jgi:hypothetical protein
MATEVTPTSRRWLWYFVGVGGVAAVLLTWLALYIRNELDPARQLNLEQLRAARNLWKEHGPKDYQMLYKVRRGRGGDADTYFVEVRGGRVISVVLNGDQRLEADKLEYHSMVGLFNDIELFLKRDEQPNSPQSFCRGYFAKEDGRLVQFVRRVVGTDERVDIFVETFKPIAAN